MDSGIDFGEVKHQQPDSALRPDQDPHLAVIAIGTNESPAESHSPIVAGSQVDLAIFIDLDVMWEMEMHARTNTSVELGGVLLGHQYCDDAGRPFVQITDCLRAEHYEATKGSFKFTHETWQTISRQRDAYPDGIQMVGWYHTHPDWGVFLSGMDLFICDNFFNRPLDVALVIDPCRDERGWFQWNDLQSSGSAAAGGIRQTEGFFVYASRFRIDELHTISAIFDNSFLESAGTPDGASGNENNDSTDNPSSPGDDMPMTSRFPTTTGGSGHSIINVREPQNQWVLLAVISMLTIQSLLLGLFAWKLLVPDQNEEIDALKKSMAVLANDKLQAARSDEQLRVIQMLANDGSDDGELEGKLAEQLVEARLIASRSEQDVQAHRELSKQQNQSLLANAVEIQQYKKSATESKNKIKELEEKIANETTGGLPQWAVWVGGGVIGLLGLATGILMASYRDPNDPRASSHTSPENLSSEHSRRASQEITHSISDEASDDG